MDRQPVSPLHPDPLALVEGIDYSKFSLPKDEFVRIVPTGFPKYSPTLLPTGAAERKAVPVASGVLDYFPAALAEIARVSKKGNDQHNPGQDLHWARGKSMDQGDTLIRHFLERGTIDPTDGLRHSAKMAWRALALLQLELEAAGAPVARGAKLP